MRPFSDYRVVDDITAGKAVSRARIEAEIRELNDSIADDLQAIEDADTRGWSLLRSVDAQRRERRVLRAALKGGG